MDPENQSRWTVPCRDDAGRQRVINLDVTAHGVLRLIPPPCAVTVWDPDLIDPLLHALLEARAAAIRRRTSN